MGPLPAGACDDPRDLAGATRIARSSKEFHAAHCGQRPSLRGDSKPHAEQK